MPDVKKIKLSDVPSFYRELIREITGYRKDEDTDVERKVLLNKDKTVLNKLYIDRECLHVKKGSRKQTAKLKEYYMERFGKKPKSNAKVVVLFMAPPRDYIPIQLTDEEYGALVDELNGEACVNKEVLGRAHEKILSRTYSEEDLEKIYDWAENSVSVVAKVFGVKEEDILYFGLHLDESFPHIQVALLPGMYVADQIAWKEYCDRPVKGDRPKFLLGDTNRVIGAEEKPIGCSVERINKVFLQNLNKNLEDAFAEMGIEVHISNGKGQLNDVQFTGKEQRKAAAIARGIEEESKRRNAELQAEFSQLYTEYDQQLKAQKAEITANREEIKSLKAEIKAAKAELKGLKRAIKEAIKEAKGILKDIGERIGGLIQTGIDKIKKAKSRKEKDEAAKEAEGQLLRIQTDAELALNAFLPFDDDEEVVDQEEEYGEEKGDI